MCRRRLDLAFLIDGSGSIEAYGRGNFRRCLNFVKRLVASFRISPRHTRVGVVLFSSRSSLVFNFRRYRNKRSVWRAIDSIRYPRGGTRIGRALRFANFKLFRRRSNRRKVSVISSICPVTASPIDLPFFLGLYVPLILNRFFFYVLFIYIYPNRP